MGSYSKARMEDVAKPELLMCTGSLRQNTFPARRSRFRTTMDFVSASTEIGRQYRHLSTTKMTIILFACKNYIVIQSSANHIQQRENVNWDQNDSQVYNRTV